MSAQLKLLEIQTNGDKKTESLAPVQGLIQDSAEVPSGDLDFYYFDPVLEAIEQGNMEVAKAFGHHNHWGYWETPADARYDVDDFARASESLTQKLIDKVPLGFAKSILDVGCGFGGTLQSINQQVQGVQLTGLNIDPRQLARARTLQKPRSGNSFNWVRGTASKLPFADASFDAVMAVECIFHFPSRHDFFQEAFRVLKPGGCLILSDIVTFAPLAGVLPKYIRAYEPEVTAIWGKLDIYCTRSAYSRLAMKVGFAAPAFQNVTRHIMPTYEFCMQKIPAWHGPEVAKVALPAFKSVKRLCQFGILRYEFIEFKKV